MSGGRAWLALAARLCLPRLRRAESLRHQDPCPLPVHVLPPADLADGRHDLRLDQGAAAHLVSHHVPPDAEQGRDLQPRTRPSPRCDPEHRLEAQTQADAGDDGAGCRQAPDRSGRNGRRLSRWRTLRWQARSRRARQDPDHRRRRNHARGQAGAPESCAGSSAFGARRSKNWPDAASIPPAPPSATASAASAVSRMRDARISRSAQDPAARRC